MHDTRPKDLHLDFRRAFNLEPIKLFYPCSSRIRDGIFKECAGGCLGVDVEPGLVDRDEGGANADSDDRLLV